MRYADNKCEWVCENAEVDMCFKGAGEGDR
jgi:hypothetical protein